MPESDDGSTGSGAAVHIADALMGTGDEEVTQVEENESWEDDDEEEVDEINHAKLPELQTEALAAFKEYRNFNRIDLCAKGGWAQYLPAALGGGLPVPVLPRAPAAVDVSAGEHVALPSASFFAPRGVGEEEQEVWLQSFRRLQ